MPPKDLLHRSIQAAISPSDKAPPSRRVMIPTLVLIHKPSQALAVSVEHCTQQISARKDNPDM
ncbi:hypothetical protein AC578_5432 [Pseudocercospora eumusae]|uniref:Uncharacterized protein n=1 Tax=Pseudocercospora eumusae TaxID=321146 RepID=A0A139HJU8_9PEZI|nr:hypothetical protein AC578_5432 [Pseudocercospora eumusae]